MRNRSSHRPWGLGVLAFAAAIMAAFVAPTAQADEISDLRERAAEISATISDLEARVASDTAVVERAKYEALQAQEKITAARARLADAKRNEKSARADVANFAMNAYVSGGSGSADLEVVLGVEGDDLGARQGYASVTLGDRQELVDRLEASQSELEDRVAALDAGRAEAAAVAEKAEAKRASAEAARAQLDAIRSQLDGKIGRLVAEKQAAEQRAEEARARARVQQQAQAEAAAQAAAASQTAPPEVSTPGPSVAQAPSPGPGVAPPAPQTTRPVPAGSGAGQVAVAAARSQLGVPYSWGGGSASGPTYGIAQGAGTRGFDCSGLTLYAWAQAGVSLPRTTYGQRNAGPSVPVSQIQPGDLVFYSGFGHMGIYAGGGQIIHAPRTGTFVSYASLYMSGGPILVVRPG